jgi:aminoglycoside phosphotransferase (APT) family kinase protein
MSDEDERPSEVTLPGEVARWIEATTGGALASAERRPGGGRREAWFVDVKRASGEIDELFLRLDRTRRAGRGDGYDTVREAQIYQALHAAGMLVPRVLGVLSPRTSLGSEDSASLRAPLAAPQAVLSERVTGETWFSRIRDPKQQLAVAQDFVRWLAKLHSIPARTLHIPALPPLADVATHVRQELDAWEAVYRADPEVTDPLIEFAFAWLRRHVPDVKAPPVLVQGDTGPGNFLYEGDRVKAILDWELAHWSDPMDDIAWLSLRAVQEPFTHFPDRLREYEQLSGNRVHAGRVRYFRVFAELRIVVMGHGRRQQRSTKGEVGNGLIYGALHHRLLVETLADVMGEKLERFELPRAAPRDHAWYFDAALEQIRDVIVPRSTDPFVVLRAKGIARLLKHLKECDRFAAVYDEQELGDLAELLGTRPASIDAGRSALVPLVRERALSDERLLRYFHRWTTRRTALAASASGVLAERHYPPLA